MKTLDLLLKSDIKTIKKIEKEVKINRLSKELNEEVIFTIRPIKLDRLQELRGDKDFDTLVVLEGVKEPNLKSEELREKFGAPTPAELLKTLLLPGEIEDLYKAISKISGYGKNTIEEIKKK